MVKSQWAECTTTHNYRNNSYDIRSLVFSSKEGRDKFIKWYNNTNEYPFNTTLSSQPGLFRDGKHLLTYLSTTSPGHYLSSGMTLPIRIINFNDDQTWEFFCWVRSNLKGEIFYHERKYFFTNRDDEINCKLRWYKEPDLKTQDAK